MNEQVGHRRTVLDAKEREVIENHLIGEVAIHLHELIHAAEQWVRDINTELGSRPMSPGMTLRFEWEPLPEARKRLLGAGGTWPARDAQARRDARAATGVLCDELSAAVLVLNLPGDARSLTGRGLRLHAERGEPYRVSVRQLLRHPPRFPDLAGRTVFLCENVHVPAAAANRLAARSTARRRGGCRPPTIAPPPTARRCGASRSPPAGTPTCRITIFLARALRRRYGVVGGRP